MLIGALSATRIARQVNRVAKYQRTHAVWQRARTKLSAVYALQHYYGRGGGGSMRSDYDSHRGNGDDDDNDNDPGTMPGMTTPATTPQGDSHHYHYPGMDSLTSWVRRMRQRLQLLARKSMGGGMTPPPATGLRESGWTFVGAFLTLATLSATAETLVKLTGLKMVLGPFGAFTCLQFALTQAPPSQPRTALYGQTVSFIVTIATLPCVHYFAIPLWLHAPLASSLAIASMAVLGVIHPPAGSTAWIIASNGDSRFPNLPGCWAMFFTLILGNVIAIAMSVLINNFNERRQYPIYW